MAARSEDETFLDSVLDATVDTILAFGSVWLFLFTLVSQTTQLVDLPVAESTLLLAAGLVAFGTIYPFVTKLWPLRRWLRFLGTAAIAFFAITLATFFVLVPISGIPAASELLQFGIFVVSLVVAGGGMVVRDRW